MIGPKVDQLLPAVLRSQRGEYEHVFSFFELQLLDGLLAFRIALLVVGFLEVGRFELLLDEGVGEDAGFGFVATGEAVFFAVAAVADPFSFLL